MDNKLAANSEKTVHVNLLTNESKLQFKIRTIELYLNKRISKGFHVQVKFLRGLAWTRRLPFWFLYQRLNHFRSWNFTVKSLPFLRAFLKEIILLHWSLMKWPVKTEFKGPVSNDLCQPPSSGEYCNGVSKGRRLLKVSFGLVSSQTIIVFLEWPFLKFSKTDTAN